MSHFGESLLWDIYPVVVKFTYDVNLILYELFCLLWRRVPIDHDVAVGHEIVNHHLVELFFKAVVDRKLAIGVFGLFFHGVALGVLPALVELSFLFFKVDSSHFIFGFRPHA